MKFGQGHFVQLVLRKSYIMHDMLKDPELVAQGRRLREARKKLFRSATAAIPHVQRFTDVELSNYTQHENGHRSYKGRAEEYAKAFDTSAAWLLWGEASEQPPMIPLAGYVAANGEEHFISNYVPGDGHDFLPTVMEDVEAVYEVAGVSMLPRYRPGEKIVVGYQTRDPSHYVNRDVVALIRGTEHRVLKTLKKGRNGLWDLKSINPVFDTITDVELEWVAPVKWVKV